MSGPVPVPRHQALRELYAYWDSKRGNGFAPPRRAIDPAEMRGLLPFIVLIDVVGLPPRFRIRLAGTKVVEAFGREITGLYVDEMDLDAVEHVVLTDLAEVVRDGRPNLAEREYTRNDGRHMKYERLVLPLSTDGMTADKLLCGVVAEFAFGPARGGSVNPAVFP